MSERPSAADLLATPGALLTRTDLRELGMGRAAVDAVFRALPVVVFPDCKRVMVQRDDLVAFIAQHTYDDDRIRPT